MSNEVPVYVNWGRFVADCRCGDARGVEPGQKQMVCAAGHTSQLAWPPNAPQLMATLTERLSDKRKNWFPRNHPLALAGGLPHGQTVDELREETQQGEQADAQALADKRAAVLAQVRSLDIPLDDVLAALKGT